MAGPCSCGRSVLPESGVCVGCMSDVDECPCAPLDGVTGDPWPAEPATVYDGAPHPADDADQLARHAGTAAGAGRTVADVDREFWSARPVLGRIETFARARRVCPWALLGETFTRVITCVPPNVQLPGYVGGRASLNLFVAIVGPSGLGKGAASQAADDLLDLGRAVVPRGIGSGEGLAKLFGKSDKDGKLTRISFAELMSIYEIDSYAGVKGRGGTLTGEMRKAFMGEPLGFSYADPEKRVPIDRHTYRLCMTIGVQPGRGEALVNADELAGGTPQRFVWLPAQDPEIPDYKPAEPGGIYWRLPAEVDTGDYHPDSPVYEMPVCEAIAEAVDAAAVARHRGETTAIDGHALLVREKVAAGLALLDGRGKVTDDDWRLAGLVMEISDQTRETITSALARMDAERNIAQAHAEANRARIVDDSADEHKTRKAKDRVMTVLRDGEWHSHSDARRDMGRHREYFEDAIEALITAGFVEVRASPSGHGSAGRQYRQARP